MRRRLAAVLLLAGVPPLSGCGAPPDPSARTESGWEVTVYYTAVESFHDGEPIAVTGCPELDCDNGDDPLGSYPEDFVTAVEDEGTGRITSGDHDGEYLNWSHDVGYWLDSEARNSHGDALRPFASAATDADVLPRGTRLTITDCGAAEVAEEVCRKLMTPTWTVDDEFTPGLGGAKHLDVYLGEADGPDFTRSPLYTTLVGASLRIRR